MMKCEIEVIRIMFPKDRQITSGDFAIFVGRVDKKYDGANPIINPMYKTISLKGIVPAIREGESYIITFDNPETNQYGTTYTVVSVVKNVNPQNTRELRDYLELMCGNKLADELMKLDNPYKLLKERNVAELLNVKGLGEKKIQQIFEKMESFSDNTMAYVKLEPLGLTKRQITNICLAVGGADSAIDICMNNPYSLIKRVKGIGFKLADEIAMKCGINPYSDIRIKSAINHVLETSGECGRSYLYAPQLLDELKKIIQIEFNILDGAVMKMVQNEELYLSSDGMKVALPFYVELEQNIAKEIMRLRDAESFIKVPENWIDTVKAKEERQGWCYTDEQMKGIETVLNNNFVVISGKAGSGKSTVTDAMSEVLSNYDISLCCLSAKASQRLREVTGLEASTIHRLLGLGMEAEDEEEFQILSDIIIVDEASMPSGSLLLKLFRSIRSGAKVIVLGDDGQLTAIGNCSVFSDLMVSKKVPHVELTKIHRQAEKSAIITKSIDFRNQIPICPSDFSGHMTMGELKDLELYVLQKESLVQQVKDSFMKEYKEIGNILEVQVICAMKKHGTLSTHNLNLELQTLVNPKIGQSFEGYNNTKIYVGDKVINLKNDYSCMSVDKSRMGVFNGSIGIVKSIQYNQVLIDFVGLGCMIIEKNSFSNINLAYAITCHSSQGSQWKRTICCFDMGAYKLLNVEIIYTALTRAIQRCTFIIERNALNYSISTIEQKTKQTLLKEFLC